MGRKANDCGNPLWVEWLEEWAAEAGEKGLKSAQTFDRAARSLKKCPIAYQHPNEAIAIQYIGKGIIDRLEKRMKEYCKSIGAPMPEVLSAATANKRPNPPNPKGKGKGKGKAAAKSAHDDDESESESSGPETSAPFKQKAGKKEKSYIPKDRSGGFGILVGLHSRCTPTNQRVWMTKTDIIAAATPFCNASFKQTGSGGGNNEGGSGFFTAWNGMKTLKNRGLVEETGRPARYVLTKDGFRVAQVCAKQAGEPTFQPLPGSDDAEEPVDPVPGPSRIATHNTFSIATSCQQQGPSYEDDLLASLSSEIDERPRPKVASSSIAPRGALNGRKAAGGSYARQFVEPLVPPPAPSFGPFEYWYLDERNERVKERDQADTIQDEQYRPLYKIEYRLRDALHPIKRKVTNEEALNRPEGAKEGATRAGYLPAIAANLRAPGFSGNITDVLSKPILGLGPGPFTSGKASTSGAIVKSAGTTAAGPRQSNPAMADLLGNFKSKQKSRDIYAFPKESLVSVSATSAATAESSPVAELRRTSSASAGDEEISMRERMARAAEARNVVSFKIPSSQSASSPPAGPTAGSSRPAPPAPALGAAPMAKEASKGSALVQPLKRTESAPILRVPAPVALPAPAPPKRTHSRMSDITFPAIEPIVYQPGTFTITLILDTREINSKTDRDGLWNAIKAKGVPVEQRTLMLGDAIWVAKRKNGLGRSEDEIVLDHILERKRLDDLCSSIKDGRYEEQKARMRRAAMTHQCYLIENWDSKQKHGEFGQQIWTSKSQTQVIDNLYVHIAINKQECVDYLAMRTKVLANLYEGSALYGIPDRQIERGTYVEMQRHVRQKHPATPYLTTYSAFQELNGKCQTHAEVWGMMASTVRTMSNEKALTFVQKWPSPMGFWEAVKERRAQPAVLPDFEEDEELPKGKRRKRTKDKWVGQEAGGEHNAQIKDALSKRVWDLWTQNSYAVSDL